MRLLAMLLRRKLVTGMLVTALMSGTLVLALGDRDRKIQYLSIEGPLLEPQRQEIERMLMESPSLADIGAVKTRLEQTDWIDEVSVVLKWPNEIVVRVEPETAIAYWNDDAFINSEGRVFESEYLVPGALPQLYGPEGSEQRVMTRYQELNQALLKAGYSIAVLTLNQRGSLEFELRNHTRVLLGNVDLKQRVKRFLKVSEKLAAMKNQREILRVDTRYSNGVAVEFEQEGLDVAETGKLQREMSL